MSVGLLAKNCRALLNNQIEFNFMTDDSKPDSPSEENVTPKKKAVKKKTPKKAAKKKTAKKAAAKKKPSDKNTRKRVNRPYPVVSFKEARLIGDAIFKYASGQKVRRLTLLEQLDRAPNSGPTKQLITNSGKYGITTGSYSAEWLELTAEGRVACDPSASVASRLKAQFKLSIDGVEPFNILYEEYKGKRLPVHNVMGDVLKEANLDITDIRECIDLFVVNVKELGLLRTIAGAETLVSIEQRLDEAAGGSSEESLGPQTASPSEYSSDTAGSNSKTEWDSTCFYITPIGAEGSDARKHSDLFLESLIEPAMAELNLSVVRADKIGNPGMITTNILEHLKRSRLVIADLSLLNPNVFYEMALRHACRLPIVQIIRKADRLPFDVNQVNSVIIDTSDIYSLVPKIETHRSEIATLARQALDDPQHVGNPITVFYPDFWK